MGTATVSDLAVVAAKLLADVVADPTGSVSPSAYETGRLVALAPWLAGHEARLAFLCRAQNPDGSWGGPDGYAVVPTLSATTALLGELARRQQDTETEQNQALFHAARGGLRMVRRWLGQNAATPAVPDTVAVEMILPALLAELSMLLPVSASDALRLPDGFDPRPLQDLQDRLAGRAPLPLAAHHCLELLGPEAAVAPSVRPTAAGVGASAAATAAWLGGPDGPVASHDFLERLQARGGGPVPNVTPISYFEGAWVLNSLAISGLAYQAPPEILTRLEAGLTDAGAPAGPGLPTDGDDTAGVLAALLRHGRQPSPEPLREFQADGYFRCFVDERNSSVSTNAHVLEALSLCAGPAWVASAAATTAAWLREQQQPDGSWWDKWHASPYYATCCCVLALSLYSGSEDRRAVDRAVGWVRDTQRADGSWGRWSGTVEETAYAVQLLARTGVGGGILRRGAAYLADPPLLAEDAPLWHGKDLYTPVTVVRAARLAARQLAQHVLFGVPSAGA